MRSHALDTFSSTSTVRYAHWRRETTVIRCQYAGLLYGTRTDGHIVHVAALHYISRRSQPDLFSTRVLVVERAKELEYG